MKFANESHVQTEILDIKADGLLQACIHWNPGENTPGMLWSVWARNKLLEAQWRVGPHHFYHVHALSNSLKKKEYISDSFTIVINYV